MARESLLAEEKALTRRKDAVNAERRKLPMVKIEKDYVFEGQEGKVGLKELFAHSRQLIVYHFMFDPAWDDGCMGCTGFVNAMGDLAMLNERDTTFGLFHALPSLNWRTTGRIRAGIFPGILRSGASLTPISAQPLREGRVRV